MYIYHKDYGVKTARKGTYPTHADMIHGVMPSMDRKYDDVDKGHATIDHDAKDVGLTPGFASSDVPKDVEDHYQHRYKRYHVW